jgi:hypothetical protein
VRAELVVWKRTHMHMHTVIRVRACMHACSKDSVRGRMCVRMRECHLDLSNNVDSDTLSTQHTINTNNANLPTYT